MILAIATRPSVLPGRVADPRVSWRVENSRIANSAKTITMAMTIATSSSINVVPSSQPPTGAGERE